jgi:hypothetical protein
VGAEQVEVVDGTNGKGKVLLVEKANGTKQRGVMLGVCLAILTAILSAQVVGVLGYGPRLSAIEAQMTMVRERVEGVSKKIDSLITRDCR